MLLALIDRATILASRPRRHGDADRRRTATRTRSRRLRGRITEMSSDVPRSRGRVTSRLSIRAVAHGGAVHAEQTRRRRAARYLTDTVAPASSSSFLSFSASSLEMPSLTLLGTPSTRSLASFRPRPVTARTTLMTSIFLSPKPSRTTSNSVFSSDRRPRAAVAGRAGHHHGAAGGRLDAVHVLQVVAQLLGLLQRQADDLVAQVLGGRRNTHGCCIGRHGEASSFLSYGRQQRSCSVRLGQLSSVISVDSREPPLAACSAFGVAIRQRGASAALPRRLPSLFLRRFCLIWLASAPPTLVSWLASVRARRQDLAHQQAQLLFAAGPLADLLAPARRVSRAPSITPPRASNLANSLSFGQPHDFLGQRDDVVAAPDHGQSSRRALRRPAASGVPSVARRARLFLTTSSWMFLPRSSLRSCSRALRVQPDDVHQQQVVARRPARCFRWSVSRSLTYLLMIGQSCACLARARSLRTQHADSKRRIRTPGLIVALIVTLLTYCPFTAVRLHVLDVVDERLDVLGQLRRRRSSACRPRRGRCRRRRCGTRPCRPCTR